jgi:type IV pilus assembly protein PilQ
MMRLVLITLALALLTGCQQPKPVFQSVSPAVTAPVVPPPPSPPPERIEYDPVYDPEIKAVFALASKNEWEAATAQISALVARDPQNANLQRVNSWVLQQSQKQREKAIEDKIRNIDAKTSPFNPTAIDLITENKDRGLPPRKDVRDAVDLIESSPYIPKNFGKTIHEQGPLFDFEAAKGPMGKVLEKEVSVHLDNVPLETVLLNLSQSSGVNMVADKSLAALTNRITANLDQVKLGEFFKYLGRNYEVQFQVGQDLVWVSDAKDPKRLMEETRFYKLRKGFVLPAQFGATELTRQTITQGPTVTVNENQKFTNRFVNDDAPSTPSIERAITNLFTGSKYMIDYERNLIVARGTIEQLAVLEKIIQEFDQPIQQVLIEARFVTLTKPAFMQLGVLWETGRPIPSSPTAPVDITGLLTDAQAKGLGLGIQYTFTNIFSQDVLTATLSALEQTGEGQTLSAPRLTVINNRPATISDGKVQYYYETYTVAQTVGQYFTASSIIPSGAPTKINSGAELNVMASIAGDGRHILLALNPIVKTDVQLVDYATIQQSDSTNNDVVIKLPQYRTQELETRVVITSGQTIAMGGVLERQTADVVESVPILGRLPYIGVLFRRRTSIDTPRYLLVFVTATILNDQGEGVIYDEPANGNKSK